VGATNVCYVGLTNVGGANRGDRTSTDPATLAHEDPAHHAAEIDEDQARHAAGLETTMEIR
jgi:hypothetical protein